MRRFSQMLGGLPVRDDSGASLMHPCIAIGMVPMPMRVHDIFEGRWPDFVERSSELFL
ncbi:hypothetical protein D3C86_2213230 [compost metagenome]